MMKSNPKSLMAALVGFVCMATSVAFAQDKPAERTCRILFLGNREDAPKEAYLYDGKSSQPVTLPTENFSPVYQLPKGALTMALAKQSVDKPENLPKDAPRIAVREELEHIYLLVMKDPNQPDAALRCQVVNANMDQIAPGQMLWFNLSDCAISAMLGTSKLVMKPQSTAKVDSPVAGGGQYSIQMFYQRPDEERMWPLFSTVWTHRAADREIGFVIPRPGKLGPLVYTVRDYRMPPAEPTLQPAE